MRSAHRLAVLTAAATGVLIVFGGLVTNTGAALAVPDWPTTFGHNMFLYPPSGMVGGVFYEHMIYDEDGNPTTTTFLDYLVPTAAEIPDFQLEHITTPSNTPGGYKGLGEGGAIILLVVKALCIEANHFASVADKPGPILLHQR